MSVIGIDLGGTKIIGALFDEKGNIHHQESSLLEGRSGRAVAHRVLQIIDALVHRADTLGDAVTAVGVCVPGIANSKTGLVWAPNIPGWEAFPLQEEVAHHLHDPSIHVKIASDRTCYILGEKWKGAAMSSDNAIFISVGTGIGVGLLIDGNVVHGHADIVGAAGWFGVGPSYSSDYEKQGCFEYYASGDGIARQAMKLLNETTGFARGVLSAQEKVTSREVFEAYAQADPLAVKVIEQAVTHWAIASANMVSLLNPELVIWGGGVFGPAGALIDRIHQEACRWAQPIAMKQVAFKKTSLQGKAGLIGAGYLALSSRL